MACRRFSALWLEHRKRACVGGSTGGGTLGRCVSASLRLCVSASLRLCMWPAAQTRGVRCLLACITACALCHSCARVWLATPCEQPHAFKVGTYRAAERLYIGMHLLTGMHPVHCVVCMASVWLQGTPMARRRSWSSTSAHGGSTTPTARSSLATKPHIV